MDRLDVFVVGGIGIDHNVQVGALPLPSFDSRVVPPIVSSVGHTGHGVAAGCAALGLRTAIFDVLGQDVEADVIHRHYATSPVELSAVHHPSGTRRSVNLVAADGARSSLYDPRHPPGFVPDPAGWREPLRRCRLVHVSIVDWARHALADTVAAGVPTSTDLQDWDGRQEYHRGFAYGADLVVCSAARLVDPCATAREILDRGRAQVVVVTDGPRGATLHPRGAAPVHVPAASLPDRPVVDSNGAGDAFTAAFLDAFLAGAPWEQAGRAGAVAGAWACGSPGTHTGFVTRAELERRMRRGVLGSEG